MTIRQLTPIQRAARRFGHALPEMPMRRALAANALRLAGGKVPDAGYDVPVFGTERAVLHPADNISEKRVFATPQFWEPAERAALAARIEAHREAGFVFLDVGANAGLYTLFAHSVCRKADTELRAILIEPDPVMQRRLSDNVRLSGIDARLFACAVSDEPGRMRLTLDPKNKGRNSLVPDADQINADGVEVEVRTLADVLAEAAPPRIDALKIDIEGAEADALRGLFTAPKTLWPAYVQIEGTPGGRNAEAFEILLRNGYDVADRTADNAFLTRRALGD